MSESSISNSFSENIGNLALAVSKLQGEVQNLVKDKKAYNYLYVELSSVLDAIRPLLSKYKLAVFQLPGSADDKVTLETIIAHESGEWMRSCIEMAVEVNKGMTKAQAVGSVISYARRYSLTAMLGIAQADNDASSEYAAPKKEQPARHQAPPENKVNGHLPAKPITEQLIKNKTDYVYSSPEEKNKDAESLTDLLTRAPANGFAEWFSKMNYSELTDLKDSQLKKWVDHLKGLISKVS